MARKNFFYSKIKRVDKNMAILQKQNSQELLTLGVKFKARKAYRPRANVQSKLNLICRAYVL